MNLIHQWYLIFTLLSAPLAATAQVVVGEHQISAGMGWVTSDDIYFAMLNHSSSGSQDSYAETFHYPAYMLNYAFFKRDRHSIGVGMSWHVAGYSVTDNPARSYNHRDTVIKDNLLSVCIETKKVFMARKNAAIYGTIAGGIRADLSDVNHTFLTFYLSPIGIRQGRQHALYCELGLGYKGLLNMGYSLRLEGAKVKQERQKLEASRYGPIVPHFQDH